MSSSQSEILSNKKRISMPEGGQKQEKDDMIQLNDKFVILINMVKEHEDKNRKLHTKLKILKGQEKYSGDVDAIQKMMKNDLQKKIDDLNNDQEKLKDELNDMQKKVDDAKKGYEHEYEDRGKKEADFVLIKQEVDEGHLEMVNDVLNLEDLSRQLDFLRSGFDEEVKELESMINDETVTLPNTSKRSLNMEDYIEEVENHYAEYANRARVEAEKWNEKKIESLQNNAAQKEQAVRDLRRDIADMQRKIQRLKADLDNLKRKEDSLKRDVEDARNEGEENVDTAKDTIKQLKEGVKKNKKDLADQIRQYQNLLNLKLALDIEIATYRKLLEGEEERMNSHQRFDVHQPERKRPSQRNQRLDKQSQQLDKRPQAVGPAITSMPSQTPDAAGEQEPPADPPALTLPKKCLLIRVEVEAGRVVSESTRYMD